MKPLIVIFIAALAAIIAAYGTVKLVAPKKEEAAVKVEQPVFDRVMANRIMRCGYVVYEPYLIKDPNTGKLSGIFYELTEKMGQMLHIKIEWAQETSFANYIEDMYSGRYDVYCGGLWPEAERSLHIEYSVPVNYVGLGVYVRSDNMRFDGDLMRLDNAQYKFATMDGEMSDFVVKTDFPKASALSHPHNTDVSQLVLAVTGKKADAVIIEKAVAEAYMQKNPGALKNLTEEKPIRVFANTWAVKKGESNVISMLNTAIAEMLNTGAVEPVVKLYEKAPNSFYPVAKPYQSLKNK